MGESISALKAYTNQSSVIETRDRRVFEGIFKCVDCKKNVVLFDSVELIPDGSKKVVHNIIIPGDIIYHMRAIRANPLRTFI